MLISEEAVFNTPGDPQALYDGFANRELTRLHGRACPCCRHRNCLAIHGYYTRRIDHMGSRSRLRVMRLACSSCGRTHALMPSGMVPYSPMTAWEANGAAEDPVGARQEALDFLARARRRLGRLYALLGIEVGRASPPEATRRLLPAYRLVYLQTSRRHPCHPLADTT